MASLFENFRSTMGADPEGHNQANVALDFARFKHTAVEANAASGGINRSTADASIARPLQNGRHAFSDQVLNAYSVAGEEADEELNTMLGELDAIAVTSQSIAQMDNATRQRYINRGLKEFDSAAITERESELQRMVMDRARPVIAENDALDRELKRINVGRMNEALSVDRLSTAAAQSEAKYNTAVENLTYDQMQQAYTAGGIAGVPRQWLANKMLETGMLESQNRSVKAALSNVGGGVNGLLAFGAGGVGQKAGTGIGTGAQKPADFEQIAETLSYNYTGDQLDSIIQQHEEKLLATPEKDRKPMTGVDLPDFGVSVPLPVLLAARKKSHDLAGTGVKTGDLAKFNTLNARLQNGAEVFTDSLVQLGGDVNMNSVMQREVIKHYDTARTALKAGDLVGAEAAIEAGNKRSSEIIESMITTRPEAQQPFMREIQRMGRPNNPESVADYVSSMNSTVAMERLPQGSPYREAGALLFAEMATLDAEANALANSLEGSGVAPSAKARQAALRDTLLDKASVNTYSQHFNAAVGERLLSTGLQAAVLGRIGELTGDAASMNNDPNASAQEIAVLQSLKNTLFGANGNRGQISNNWRKQRPVLNDDGQPMTDASGQPLEFTAIAVSELIAAVSPFQTRLKEMGSQYEIFTAMRGAIESNSQRLAGELLPNSDPTKQAIFYMVNGAYRSNNEADANTVAMGLVNQQLGLLDESVNRSEAAPVRVSDLITANAGSAVEQDMVKRRADEIMANFDTLYDEKIGGVEKARLINKNNANPDAKIQAAYTQSRNELQMRAKNNTPIGGSTPADEKILEQILSLGVSK